MAVAKFPRAPALLPVAVPYCTRRRSGQSTLIAAQSINVNREPSTTTLPAW